MLIANTPVAYFITRRPCACRSLLRPRKYVDPSELFAFVNSGVVCRDKLWGAAKFGAVHAEYQAGPRTGRAAARAPPTRPHAAVVSFPIKKRNFS
ncbi:hypothetical protein EVAR_50270_1 [Eumeta japonica]|uniref:Uncharacterized protein n=1 Tax=Eumeta variegata TaxID=151549 RepID=A0A4C1Y935_EUMVA|nr:hypothetical protein EVAR_50270_1 [Eumeta japonica]